MVDVCTGVVYLSENNKAGIISGIVIGSLAAIAMIVVFRYRRRKKKLASGGETAEFVPSRGELNHVSDIVSEQPRQKHDDADFLTGNDADAAISDEDDDAFLENVVSEKTADTGIV